MISFIQATISEILPDVPKLLERFREGRGALFILFALIIILGWSGTTSSQSCAQPILLLLRNGERGVWLCGGRKAVIGYAYQPEAERDGEMEMEGKWDGVFVHLHPSLPASLYFSVSEDPSEDKALVSRAAGLAARNDDLCL